MVTTENGSIIFGSTSELGLFGETYATTYGGNLSGSSSYASQPSVAAVFLAATVLAVIAVILGAGMTVLAASTGNRGRFRWFVAVLALAAFLLTLGAPLYVTLALPGALANDMGPVIGYHGMPMPPPNFWWTETSNVGPWMFTTTSGAGWGWYLVMIGAALFLLAGVGLLRTPVASTAGRVGQLA